MRKLLTVLLVLALVLGLASCGRKDSSPHPDGGEGEPDGIQTPAESRPAEPEKEDKPSGVGEEPTVPDQGAAKPEEPQPAEPEKPEESGEAEPVKHVSHVDVTLRCAGESFRLTVWDSDGRDPDSCTYTSADPSVAAVDEGGGEVTAVAPGTTTVTAHAVFGEEALDFDCIVRCVWEEEKGEDLPASGPGDGESCGYPLAPAADAQPSLTDFFATLQGSYEGLGAMMTVEGEVLDAYYPGLSGNTAVEELLILETRMSMSNVAVGLVKFSEEAALEDILAVQDIFQARITAQAEGGAWYPASCETWEQGIITSVSRYMGMFVYPDGAQSMADLFTETFSKYQTTPKR